MLILFSKTEWVGELSWSNGIDTQVFIDSFTAFFSTAIPLAMILGVLVSWPFISAVYWVLARILGGSGSFKGTMTVYGYASIPHIFLALMAIVWTFLAPTRVVDLSNMTNITNISDLSALIPPYYMLNLILNQGLSLWSAALISLGLQYSHHLSRQRAFGIGIGIWAILLTANLVQTWMLL